MVVSIEEVNSGMLTFIIIEKIYEDVSEMLEMDVVKLIAEGK